MKRRKLGAGAKKSLDTEDEEFIARSIEETSTAHVVQLLSTKIVQISDTSMKLSQITKGHKGNIF